MAWRRDLSSEALSCQGQRVRKGGLLEVGDGIGRVLGDSLAALASQLPRSSHFH